MDGHVISPTDSVDGHVISPTLPPVDGHVISPTEVGEKSFNDNNLLIHNTRGRARAFS